MKSSSHRQEPAGSRGALVAELLSAALRNAPPVLTEGDLGQLSNVLTQSGAGGIAWCAIRNTELRTSGDAEVLHAQYRLQSLRSAIHERNLKRVIPMLRANGVEPVLVKGWSIARFYPEAGMRPYLDLDFCVLPEQFEVASKALKNGECNDFLVDLHRGFGSFYEHRDAEIFSRTRLVRLDDLDVRVLCDEDHLRFLCVHLLRHGAVQPLWLADVALLLAQRSNSLDWTLCLTESKREADWVACVIGLAHQLLGAEVHGTPVESRAKDLPAWLVPVVLNEWGTPVKALPQFVFYMRNPRNWVRDFQKELSRHWPNPIEATMTLGGSFNDIPRLPFQLGHLASRTIATFRQAFFSRAISS